MRPAKIRKKGNPEQKIQKSIINLLERKGWFVLKTHGNMYQSGLPDLFAIHWGYGHRWIEVKNPKSFHFTSAQKQIFPQLVENGSGVWVLVAGTEDEYSKLFKDCNWFMYLQELKP